MLLQGHFLILSELFQQTDNVYTTNLSTLSQRCDSILFLLRSENCKLSVIGYFKKGKCFFPILILKMGDAEFVNRISDIL